MRDNFNEERPISFVKMLLMAGIIVVTLLVAAWLLIWTADRTSRESEQRVSEEQAVPGTDEDNDVQPGDSEGEQDAVGDSIGPDTEGNDVQDDLVGEGEPEDSSQQEDQTGTGVSEDTGESASISDSDNASAEDGAEVFIPEKVEENTDLGMIFDEVKETVTSKDATNLRNIPDQGTDSTVLRTLYNGEKVTRIGISDSGWSKLEVDGQICYAVSSLLTTDLTYKPAEEVAVEDDGVETEFAQRNEKVSPKIRVNLRALPSVTHPEATVVATLQYGEIVTRTGINTDLGWSRVDYNGQTLYCISSYIYVVEE